MEKIVYNLPEKGLSVTAFNTWFVNPVACELKYFHNLEPVTSWNKNTGYGSLVGTGIEGYIRTRNLETVKEYINRLCLREFKKYSDYEEIVWWSELAIHQTQVMVNRYSKDFDRYHIGVAEEKINAPIKLPSGRTIVLTGKLDGSSKDGSIIFEHKCKKDWNESSIVDEIDLDLQVNWYLTLCLAKYGSLPKTLWYQHSRRPGGFGYRGPKRKVKETEQEFLIRTCEYISDNEDDHFYQFIAKPKMDRYNRFLHCCMYPLLEKFLDWWEYMINRKGKINKYHYMTPYGIYNPYLEGTEETFRKFALTGSTIGLRKVSYESNKEKTNTTSNGKGESKTTN